ncbi:hypothetical protein PUNSTDRAFT_48073 [Punctularia strigosozonata HHB-11173 SS5]|uniref:Uncharacterized protein n=1 Tax=Punctularia strigosozonata (strain HHB-11173) TaxID=741275 RepID=R7S2N5_PUNST|nr:uncharacterized protein PUNSTDRAFT_48073 [Punctularia strigosozonata HHB-11173 SS5]EIN03511.1 hypothetical protein PUNSTDRAFT_48073 [Punctularia strigosozonata HHB-11173 SS5]
MPPASRVSNPAIAFPSISLKDKDHGATSLSRSDVEEARAGRKPSLLRSLSRKYNISSSSLSRQKSVESVSSIDGDDTVAGSTRHSTSPLESTLSSGPFSLSSLSISEKSITRRQERTNSDISINDNPPVPRSLGLVSAAAKELAQLVQGQTPEKRIRVNSPTGGVDAPRIRQRLDSLVEPMEDSAFFNGKDVEPVIEAAKRAMRARLPKAQPTPASSGTARVSDADASSSAFAAIQKQRYSLELILFENRIEELWDQPLDEIAFFNGCLALRDLDSRPAADLPVPRILDISIDCADNEEQRVERVDAEDNIELEGGIAMERCWHYSDGVGSVGNRGWFSLFWVPLPMSVFHHGDYIDEFTITAAVRVGFDEQETEEPITFAASESTTISNLRWADYAGKSSSV